MANRGVGRVGIKRGQRVGDCRGRNEGWLASWLGWLSKTHRRGYVGKAGGDKRWKLTLWGKQEGGEKRGSSMESREASKDWGSCYSRCISMPKDWLNTSPGAERREVAKPMQFANLLICKWSLMRTNVYLAIEFKGPCQNIARTFQRWWMLLFVCVLAVSSPLPLTSQLLRLNGAPDHLPLGFRKPLHQVSKLENSLTSTMLRARFNGCLYSPSLW